MHNIKLPFQIRIVLIFCRIFMPVFEDCFMELPKHVEHSRL